MIEQPARVEQFQQEIDAMQLRDPAVTRERNLLRLGGILMVAGIVVAAGAYVLDRSANVNSGQAQQLDALSLGLLGVAITVVGGAMFLRYSLGQFLRFWLAPPVVRAAGRRRPGLRGHHAQPRSCAAEGGTRDQAVGLGARVR